MGKPRTVNLCERAQCARGVPGEVKHLSTQRKRNRRDSVSSGERKRNSLNRVLRTQVESLNFSLACGARGVIGKDTLIHVACVIDRESEMISVSCFMLRELRKSYKIEN